MNTRYLFCRPLKHQLEAQGLLSLFVLPKKKANSGKIDPSSFSHPCVFSPSKKNETCHFFFPNSAQPNVVQSLPFSFFFLRFLFGDKRAGRKRWFSQLRPARVFSLFFFLVEVPGLRHNRWIEDFTPSRSGTVATPG